MTDSHRCFVLHCIRFLFWITTPSIQSSQFSSILNFHHFFPISPNFLQFSLIFSNLDALNFSHVAAHICVSTRSARRNACKQICLFRPTPIFTNFHQFCPIFINFCQFLKGANNFHQLLKGVDKFAPPFFAFHHFSAILSQFLPISRNFHQFRPISGNFHQFQPISANFSQFRAISGNFC